MYAAMAQLDALISDNVIFKGTLKPHDQSFSDQKLEMLETLQSIERTDRLLQNALGRRQRPRGSPASYGNLRLLVQNLDGILHRHSGRIIDRSKKRIGSGTGTPLEFVWAVTYINPTTRICASGFASMYLCVVRKFEWPASS